MCITKVKHLSGFTLLEMLIAIAIFAMLGIAANSILSTVMKNDEVTKEFADRLKSLQQGFGALERDLGQMVARTPRLIDGRGSQFFQVGGNILDSETEALMFYRLGWLNPDGMLPRGSLQSVAYVVQNGRLERWYYPYPEPISGAEPLKSVVIDHVLSIEYSFYMDDKWQKNVDGTVMPKGIAMEIELEGLGKIQRRFLLPKGAPATKSTADDDKQGNNNNGGSV
ncbi:MAG: type II secretion system minor pseudopilin GspJ [Shewanella psychromarinicola]|jgi:general secretion pathway protein J|uniref:Type II secretion system protein J n=1 Tax=Shewanella psychromarinicola TaxID=2487742 RepID=A0A3N4E721_9GAMM|nr:MULTISPECIES: type II secretion system minor pseudopilin GspJ [Shewanella]AZG34452.1 type II secretion system protein GspJ [Shewanella psychromarinicola]MCL1081992.1 type II secretion system minor pseudopilin GspJ [Shewanella psychromarinicola]PKG79453.1 type II secretion system protein GspJ [Shewanella sp. Actino-trap-3]RPA32552.1 type II secretion system protein GspJ [Shewanella psychromarinicola]|tara:strand:- start:13824 stop:14498 length:675 start_codon:yes stop_codon:yes gene_type:complete